MYPPISLQALSGDEVVHRAGAGIGISVLDFWRWSASDLLGNTARGIFAEFLVATALGATKGPVRNEWEPFDVLSPEGVKVEVKSCAYIQSWHQTKPSVITFGVRQTRAWSAEANKWETEERRQADVYVFALLAHRQQETIDPLNVDQWEFYVVPTSVLDETVNEGKSIGLATAEKLSGGAVRFEELRGAVKSVVSTAR